MDEYILVITSFPPRLLSNPAYVKMARIRNMYCVEWK